MDLEQMRQALASEATEKAKKQEEEIARLKKELSKKRAIIGEKNDMLRVMFNRCYARNAQILMCLWCEYRPTCDKLRSVGKEGANNDN